MGAAHIFLSHSSADRALADGLTRELEAAGVRLWVAPRNVAPGSDYAETIHDAIDGCAAMIVLVSESANQSRHVRAETEMAFSRGKPLFPVRFEDIKPARGLELFLGLKHWTDLYGAGRQASLARLGAELAALGDLPHPPPPPQEPSKPPVQLAGAAEQAPEGPTVRWFAFAGCGGLALIIALLMASRMLGLFGSEEPTDSSFVPKSVGKPEANSASQADVRAPAGTLYGGEVALAQWRATRVPDVRSRCPPVAFASDGGANGVPRAGIASGWAVDFDTDLQRAYGIVGTGGAAPSDRELDSFPYRLTLSVGGEAGFGLTDARDYSPGNPSGEGEESIAYVRFPAFDCSYQVYSYLGRRHLETLLRSLRFVQTR